MKFKIKFVETGEHGESITDTVEAVDTNTAIATFIKRHYGSGAVLHRDLGLCTGTRIYGQVMKKINDGQNRSISNSCFVDVDECL